METSKNVQRLKRRLESDTGKAIADYNMIEAGDTVMVCISGGKDSFAMLSILMALQQRAPVDFRLIAITWTRSNPAFPPKYFPATSLAWESITGSSSRIRTRSSRKKSPKEKRPARSAHASGAA